uniref:Type VI secretion system secreted protein Hcp n=1 Tax=Candidatus Kentrum sp. DK TaxID=2126562 RepID=A0A450TDT8_9GAMM|nr:MAG: type VI secretion system secreted protein Hcp [Candidatus Kentron sp. DK]VFJ67510.1 MAG: type VI secretion system secreted protein Hcp [Candidatus Kentron sp. DK]
MSGDVFLKIEGVTGESQDEKHKDEIDVLGWSWGLMQTGTMHVGSGGGAGKAMVQDISITKFVDKSSPELLASITKGEHFKNATLICRKAGGSPIEYLKIEMEEVMITNLSTGGSGEATQTENITLNFRKFTYTYTPQKDDGTAEAAITKKYDIAMNKPE